MVLRELELLNSALPPAARLTLVGDGLAPSVSKCVGAYHHVAGKRINERPVWRHATRSQLYLAFSGTAWYVQKQESLGTDAGLLCLDDPRCLAPELSRVSWAAAADGGWLPQPTLRCVEDQVL